MDAAAHGAELHAKGRGDLFVGQALDVAQHHGCAVFGGQRFERGGDVVVKVAIFERLGGSGAGAMQALCRVIAKTLEANALTAPRHVEEEVRGDAVQPALEGPWRVPADGPE